MQRKLIKLTRLTPNDWWDINLAYLHLLWAGWRLFIRKEKLDHWVMPLVTSPLGKEASRGIHCPGAPSLLPPGEGGMAGEYKAKPPLAEEERHTLARRARWVNAAAHHPWPWARCLQRSLALCLWLERQGLRPELKIGVRKAGVALEAHAWVEYCGEVINDRPNVSGIFIPLTGANPRLPGTWR